MTSNTNSWGSPANYAKGVAPKKMKRKALRKHAENQNILAWARAHTKENGRWAMKYMDHI